MSGLLMAGERVLDSMIGRQADPARMPSQRRTNVATHGLKKLLQEAGSHFASQKLLA